MKKNDARLQDNELFNLSLFHMKQPGMPNYPEESTLSLPEILFITSYPPRECGIATYSLDLVEALNSKFENSFTLQICPLENDDEQFYYPGKPKNRLNVDSSDSFQRLAKEINDNPILEMVVIQHEFGFFEHSEAYFIHFLQSVLKPVVIVFHTVLPNPGRDLRKKVRKMALEASHIVVMTQSSSHILTTEYGIKAEKITVIPHGTHLVPHVEKSILKKRYDLSGRKVLSTFGLLSSGKSIETTLDALPAIVAEFPETIFLVIGKTHPTVVKKEGESYRNYLEDKVKALSLQDNVRFINQFVPLSELLEYLQLSDIYLFTSKNPDQAVSGTFSYAIGCGCPIVSTPIPHALEVLGKDAGMIVGFENPAQLAKAALTLLGNKELRKSISFNGLHKMASTAWENSSVAHALLFKKIAGDNLRLQYQIPEINLDHIKRLTTGFAMIQFSKINHPDHASGYTLDDNARALVAMCQHYELTRNEEDLSFIWQYYRFIQFCLQPQGNFLNYVDSQHQFTTQNDITNLEDSKGRGIWAIGYLLSMGKELPSGLVALAGVTFRNALENVENIHSTRAMAFIIKGLYYANLHYPNTTDPALIRQLANRLLQMYRHESNGTDWNWYESYLTYANSVLPEAMLCAWMSTGDKVYKETAQKSFDFLLKKIFANDRIQVISNRLWLNRGDKSLPFIPGGEQPIDVAYTILALDKFYGTFRDPDYLHKLRIAFEWFLGNNHLNQIIYNPGTGGCYDGLEEYHVNLNQGAESTVSYLMARLTVEKLLYPDRAKRQPIGFIHSLMNKTSR